MNIYKNMPYALRVALQIVMALPLGVCLIAILLVLLLGWGGSAALAFIKAWDELVLEIGNDDDYVDGD